MGNRARVQEAGIRAKGVVIGANIHMGAQHELDCFLPHACDPDRRYGRDIFYTGGGDGGLNCLVPRLL